MSQKYKERITNRFSASCNPQQESQKNLFFAHSISLALNCLKHAVTDEFCSMSIERSMNDSSREETVSHVRQRVSLVKTPSNSLCTMVEWYPVACAVDVEGAGCVDSVAIDVETSWPQHELSQSQFRINGRWR